MTLRQEIVDAVKSASGDAEQAAIAICRLLEDRLGLEGNGWLDDDEEMRELLSQ
jgi:hypothetical protein